MTIKPATLPLMLWIAASAIAPLHAQNSEFRIGQILPAQPAAPSPPASSGSVFIAPMTSPIQPTANPIAPFGGPVSPQPQQQLQRPNAPEIITRPGFGVITVLPAGGTVFVPPGTLVIENGPGLQTGAFVSAPPVPSVPSVPSTPAVPQSPGMPGARGGGASIERSSRGAGGSPPVSAADSSRLALGTTRDMVIEKYGNPIAFILNMNGETLYFKGGVVVFVKDGVVAQPGIPDAATRP